MPQILEDFVIPGSGRSGSTLLVNALDSRLQIT